MKTNVSFPTLFASPRFGRVSIPFLLGLFLTLATCLSGCKKSNDDVTPTAAFAGTFVKQSTDPAKRYEFVITKVAGEPNAFNISNFANFVPNVKATGSGNTLTIAKQTFPVGGGGQITLTGEGLLAGDVLNISYSVRGSSNFDGLTEAKRK